MVYQRHGGTALVSQHRLPTIHNLRQFSEAGALKSYGINFAELHRSAAYVDKILKGQTPAICQWNNQATLRS
jgi:ABC-type uncharacterized transport system substrate-binding protein